MKSKHTPGKWKVDEVLECITACDPNCLARVRLADIPDMNSEPESMANAQRIVDCVNGCAGINPGAVKDLLAACKAARELAQLIAFLDEPLEHQDMVRKIMLEIDLAVAEAEEVTTHE